MTKRRNSDKMVGDGRRPRAVAVALAVGFSLGGQPAPAIASPHRPTGSFAHFADCPLSAPVLEDCLYATVDEGTVTIGRRTLPIQSPVVLQGGFYEGPEEEYLVFVGAEDGDTLPPTQLNVPGGLTGLISPGYMPAPLQAQLSRSSTGVIATMQIAGPAGDIGLSTENFLFDTGVALQLPVKIKLSNQFLGGNCYIGSSSNPVILSMTTGTTSPLLPNRPIKGSAGTLRFKEGDQLIEMAGSQLVDNAFDVPRATGCGTSSTSIVDSALDATLGLPSAAGHNTAIFDGTFTLARPAAVRESE